MIRHEYINILTRPMPSYLAGYTSMNGTALPEPPFVAFDVADKFPPDGKVHLPHQGPVAEHPHGFWCVGVILV